MDPKLTERFNSLNNTLAASGTAHSGAQMPSMSDINTQQQLVKAGTDIRAAKDKALKDSWYGTQQDEKTDTGVSSPGLLNKTLNALMTPLYGVVGAVDYATGQSRANSLGGAINLNMNEDKRTFGDTLRPAIGGKAGAIAGFAADIVFDPVNWATMGTAALIPKLVTGGYKGGLKSGITGAAKGVSAAAESRALETMLTARALTLGTTKTAANVASFLNPLRLLNKGKALPTRTAQAAEQTSNFMKFVEGRATKANKTYDDIVGSSVIERAFADKTVASLWRAGLAEGVERIGTKSPVVKEYFNKYFNYSNAEWTRVSRIKDALIQTAGEDMELGVKAFVKSYDNGADYATALKLAEDEMAPIMAKRMSEVEPVQLDAFSATDEAVAMSKTEFDKVISGLSSTADAEDLITFSKLIDDANNAANIAVNPQAFITQDPIENGLRLAAEKGLIDGDNLSGIADDLRRIIERGDLGESGVEWYDNLRKNMNVFSQTVADANKAGVEAPLKDRVGDKVNNFFKTYETLMAFFKRGAVAASASAWTNSLLGNLVMAKMVGLDILDPKWMSSMKKADSIIGGKSGSELMLNELFEVGEILPMLRNNPTLFEATTGLKRHELEQVSKAKALVNRFKQTGVDIGVLTTKTTDADVVAMMEKTLRDSMEGITAGDEALQTVAEGYANITAKAASKSPSARLRASIGEDGVAHGGASTDLISTEFFDSPGANKAFKKIADKAKEDGNYGAKIADVLFNKLPDAYGGIDYRYKLGSVFYTTVEGVKEQELRVLARMTKMSPEDVTPFVKDGVTRYRLSSAAAFEVANEAFLNYAAMPAVVKMLRHLPFVGAPFASFMYGMYSKTLKTAMNNPSVFNKIQFGIDEISGEETPIERGLLAMERYEYLNDPAMMKLNLPGNNMVFLNMANMLPYYSLNMFQPSSRKYEEVLPNAIVQTMDKLPLMQDPIGSTLFDYLILPMFLKDELPQGGFGQPLYPTDATKLEKAGYLARSLADPFVPGMVQIPLGLATGALAPGISQLVPGYRWRQIAESVQGNTNIGAQSKEGATQRTFRNLGGAAGIPIQTPVPYSYLDEEEISNKTN